MSDAAAAVAAGSRDSAGPADPPVQREPVGHGVQKQWFANSLAKGRLGGTFLLVGPPGVGKAALATWIAKCLFCHQTAAETLAACGHCPGCVQVDAGSHPDLVRVGKPADRAYIPLDLLIGPPEARMQSGFCRDIRLRPFKGTRKVAILDDADFLNEEGANSLLKTFEEPPPDAVIFLLGTSEQRQLPTIRSRCQVVRLHPPQGEEAVELMRRRGIQSDAATIQRAIELCGGDCDAAASWLSDQSEGLRAGLVKQLSQTPLDPMALAQAMTATVDELGKNATGSAKRDRLRDMFAIAVHTFRQHMVRCADQPQALPPILYRLDRSLEAIHQVQRNANQTTLIECWAADLARGYAAE